MAKQLLNYKGVYGEQEQPFWDTAIHIEPLVKRSKTYDFEIKEHLHTNLIQIFLLKRAKGTLSSEGKQIPIETPCFIVIPNGVLHGFIWEPTIKGSVLTVSLSFYESCLKKHQNALIQFQQLQYMTFEGDDPQFKELVQIKDSLEKEVADQGIDKHAIVQLLFKLLMIKLYRKSMNENTRVISNDNRTLRYFNAFQKEISRTIERTKTTKDYAKALNITPVHLNRICQSLVQKSALQIIHEKLTTEAKNHLLYTDVTIAEVAYALNFKDPSHFSKFFKKMVGVGPRKFRQRKEV